MKAKGFTLVEIIIVVIIIAILLAALARFNNKNIFLLENKTTNEKVINLFENAFARINSSQYIGKKKYDQIQISFWESNILLEYQGKEINEGTEEEEKVLAIEEVLWLQELKLGAITNKGEFENPFEEEEITIMLTPFHITGNIVDTEEKHYPEIYLYYETKGDISSCFTLSENYARIQQRNCDKLGDFIKYGW